VLSVDGFEWAARLPAGDGTAAAGRHRPPRHPTADRPVRWAARGRLGAYRAV